MWVLLRVGKETKKGTKIRALASVEIFPAGLFFDGVGKTIADAAEGFDV